MFFVVFLLIICFLYEGLTFRHMLYSKYKANRTPTPDTVVQALQYLKASIKALSIKVIEVNPVVSINASTGTVQVFMVAYISKFFGSVQV